MKQRCAKCNGKGGVTLMSEGGLFKAFIPCLQCRGDGRLWTKKRAKERVSQKAKLS